MYVESTLGRVAITAAIAAFAALVGLLTGRATSDEPAPAAPPVQGVAGPAPEAAAPELRRELDRLAETRAAELERLRRAGTPAAQERSAAAIVDAYRAAATVAEAAAPAAVIAALEQAADAWRRVAVAAARAKPAAYDKARSLVRSSELQLAERLEASLNRGGT